MSSLFLWQFRREVRLKVPRDKCVNPAHLPLDALRHCSRSRNYSSLIRRDLFTKHTYSYLKILVIFHNLSSIVRVMHWFTTSTYMYLSLLVALQMRMRSARPLDSRSCSGRNKVSQSKQWHSHVSSIEALVKVDSDPENSASCDVDIAIHKIEKN